MASVQGIETRTRILQVIESYFQQHGYCPSYTEIMEITKIKSKYTIHRQIQKMLIYGLLETDCDPGTPRALRIPGYQFVKIGDDKTQNSILKIIETYFQQHGYCPSYAEIMELSGIQSKSSIHYQIKKLLKLGLLETDCESRVPRALRVSGLKFVKQTKSLPTEN